MKNTWIMIPARQGSKGFKNKNRLLFDYTAQQIPLKWREKTVVTTDDEELLEKSKKYKFRTLKRHPDLSHDDVSMKLVIQDMVRKFDIPPQDDIITLYLTYPQRTIGQIEKAYNLYENQDASSLLCKKDVITHPYMCYYEVGENRGQKIIDHSLYRRQEYPPCFEICHYIIITKGHIIDHLDNNLYHTTTLFHHIGGEIYDVDYYQDLKNFQEASPS
jgi:CMP-N,N'-diacetyllegionaminic acid synthase